MKSKAAFIAAASVAVMLVLCVFQYDDASLLASRIAGKPIVMIDPGHGGIDGGAESRDGTCEKDINLRISVFLKKELEKKGITAAMTRTEDRGLYEREDEGTIRSLKTADMRQRRSMIDSSGCDLAVSVHLNSFTQDETVRGAQVFYGGGGKKAVAGKSRRAAEHLQHTLNAGINQGNEKHAMEKNDVLLLRDPVRPTVIVECGFLSNPEEAEKLKTRAYQKEVADILADSISGYICKKAVKDCKIRDSEKNTQR